MYAVCNTKKFGIHYCVYGELVIYYLKWVREMDVGGKLKTFRNSLRLNQSQFAKAIGSTQQCISNYERGISEPSLEVLLRITETFNTSLDELLGDSHNKIDRELIDLLSKMPESKKKLSKIILETIGNES